MKKHEYTVANTFFKRFAGLMLRRKAKPLFIPKCRAIHTFFMLRAVDLCWVDKNMNMIRSDKRVAPFRISICRNAYGVIEKLSHRRNRGLFADKKGQALVEFALIFPIIFVLIIGFIEISLVISEKQKMTHAVSFAAQTGALSNNDNKIAGALNRFYKTGPGTGNIYQIESLSSGYGALLGSRGFGDIITVRLQKDYELPVRLPFLGLEDFHSIQITTEASSRVLCNNVKPPYTCD